MFIFHKDKVDSMLKLDLLNLEFNEKDFNFAVQTTTQFLKDKGFDGWITSSRIDRLWLTGFDSTYGYLIVLQTGRCFLFLDDRYLLEAKTNLRYKQLVILPLKKLLTIFNNTNDFKFFQNFKKLVFEENYGSYKDYLSLKKIVKNKCLLTASFSQSLRIIKRNFEIKRIKKAAEITDKVLLFLKKEIKVGITELELKKKLIISLYHYGADGLAFSPIVLFGKNCAFPHGKSTSKKLTYGDFITLDYGASYKNYLVDMTRTFAFINKNDKYELNRSSLKNNKLWKIYEIVYEAQKRAIQNCKPGIKISFLDKIARQYIIEQGYGKYFIHNLGHGVGLEIHEEPFIKQNIFPENILKEGMIITIEPGIYIKGIGGVRIEDTILITKTGYKILTKSSKRVVL